MILWKLWLHFKLQKVIRKLPECRDEDILEIWQSLLEKYPSARSVKIVMTDQNNRTWKSTDRSPRILIHQSRISADPGT